MPSIIHSPDALEVSVELLAPFGMRVGNVAGMTANGRITAEELSIADGTARLTSEGDLYGSSLTLFDTTVLFSNAAACLSSLELLDTPYGWSADGVLRASALTLEGELGITANRDATLMNIQAQSLSLYAANNSSTPDLVFSVSSEPQGNVVTVYANAFTNINGVLELDGTLQTPDVVLLDSERNLQNLASAVIDGPLSVANTAMVVIPVDGNAATFRVGVGTSAPVHELDVVGSLQFTSDLYVEGTLILNEAFHLQNLVQANIEHIFANVATVAESLDIGERLSLANLTVLTVDGDLSNIRMASVESLAVANSALVVLVDETSGETRVGVGTSDPGHGLEVGEGDLRITQGDLLVEQGDLWMENKVILSGGDQVQLGNVVAASLGMQGDTLVVTREGRVGVRTTEPRDELDVYGFIRFTEGIKRADGTIIITPEGTMRNIETFSSDTMKVGDYFLYVPPAGRVGIHTDAPNATLDVGGDIRFQDVLRGVRPYLTTDGHLANLASLRVAMPDGLAVLSDGRVGIGTQDPAYSLDVAGTLHLQHDLWVDGTLLLDATGHLMNVPLAEVQSLRVGTQTLVANVLGRVGVQVDVPEDTLDVGGTLRIRGDLCTANGDVVLGANRHLSNLFTAAIQEVLTVGGQVGIGTDAPQEALDVAGTIKAQTLSIGNGWRVDALGNMSNVGALDMHGELTVGSGAILSGPVAIGDLLTAEEALHVGGNVLVDGDLRVRGNTIIMQTELQNTSALVINNAGTAPAAIFNQMGNQRILEVQDDGVPVFVVNDQGLVGIGTPQPETELDLHGTLSIGGVPILDDARHLFNMASGTFEEIEGRGRYLTHVTASRLEPCTGTVGRGIVRRVYLLPDDFTQDPSTSNEMDEAIVRSTLTDLTVEDQLLVGAGGGLVHEFVGYLRVTNPGTYAFGLNSPGAADLFLENVRVADWYGIHTAFTNPARPGGIQRSLDLTEGYHRIYLRVCTLQGASAGLHLFWKEPSAADFVLVPSTALFLGGLDAVASVDRDETRLLGRVQARFRSLPALVPGARRYPPGPMAANTTEFEGLSYGNGTYTVAATLSSDTAWRACSTEHAITPGWAVSAPANTTVSLRITLPYAVVPKYLGLYLTFYPTSLYVRLFGVSLGMESPLLLQGKHGFVPLTRQTYFPITENPERFQEFHIEFKTTTDAAWEVCDATIMGSEETPLVVETEDRLSSNPTPHLMLGPEGRLGVGTRDPADTLHVTGGGILIEHDTKQASGGYVHFRDAEYRSFVVGGVENKLQVAPSHTNIAYTASTTWSKEGCLGLGVSTPLAQLDVRPSDPLLHFPPEPLTSASTSEGFVVRTSTDAPNAYVLFQAYEEPDALATSVILEDEGYASSGGQYMGQTETLLENGELLQGAWVELVIPLPMTPSRIELITTGAEVNPFCAPRHLVLVGSRDGHIGSWERIAEATNLDPRSKWAVHEWTAEVTPTHSFFRWIVRSTWSSAPAVHWTRLRMLVQPARRVAEVPAVRVQGTTSLDNGHFLVDTDPVDPTLRLVASCDAFSAASAGGFTDGRWIYLPPSVDILTGLPSNTVQALDPDRRTPMPPALTAASTTIEGSENLLVDGTYEALASSSVYQTEPHYAWDGRDDTYWHSAETYDMNTGVYLGSAQTHDIQGTAYPGEWLQIAFPTAVRLSYYAMRPRIDTSDVHVYRSPRRMWLMASRTGADHTFVVIEDRTFDDWPAGAQFCFLDAPSDPYRFYRWVIPSVGHRDLAQYPSTILTRNSVQITSLQLFTDILDPQPTVVSLSLGSTIAKGFRGGVSDGTYGYLVPSGLEMGGTPHGQLIRFRLRSFSHPQALDLATSDPLLKGFRGGVQDGRFLYLFPTQGRMPRIDLATFSLDSWMDLRFLPSFATGIISDGVVVDRHLILASENQDVLLRIETEHMDASHTSMLSLDRFGLGTGIASLCVIHGFVFVLLRGNDTGRVLRLDPRHWSSGGNLVVLDVGDLDPMLRGFSTCTTEGRYGYLVPFENLGGVHGHVVRFDPLLFHVPPTKTTVYQIQWVNDDPTEPVVQFATDALDGSMLDELLIEHGFAVRWIFQGQLYQVVRDEGLLDGTIRRVRVRGEFGLEISTSDLFGITESQFVALITVESQERVVRSPLQRMDVTTRTGIPAAAGFLHGLVVKNQLHLLPSIRLTHSSLSVGDTYVALQLSDQTWAGVARIASDQVVLGRDTASRVNVQGSLRVAADGLDGGVEIGLAANRTGASALRVTAPHFQHVFDGAGRVGIRTSAPTHDLDVCGSLAANGWTLRMGRERAHRFFEDVHQQYAGPSYAGMRFQWSNIVSDVQRAFRVVARCTLVGSETEHAFRRVELLVNPANGLQLAMLDSSMYMTDGFSGLRNRVISLTSTSTELRFELTSTLTSYRMSVDVEVVAPLELGPITAVFVHSTPPVAVVQ